MTQARGEDFHPSIELPAAVHYELILQMLERRTVLGGDLEPRIRKQIGELIVALRKAQSQQRQLEQSCRALDIDVEYRWALNVVNPPRAS